MKIGIDARFWSETGVGRYIRNLVFELDKLDTPHNFVLFVRKQQVSEIKKVISTEKISLVPTTVHWHTAKEQLLFSREITNQQIDLMHFTYFSVPVLYSRPFVVTIHDLINHHFATGAASTLPMTFYQVKLKAYKYIINKAAEKAKKVIAVSDATKAEIIDHLHIDEKKIVVTYEGIDQYVAQQQKKENIFGNYFLHVGNVYPHKNAQRLVDAFEYVRGDDLKLLFVGKKDHFMQELERYVHRKKMKSVIFVGYVDDLQLSQLYQQSLATVIPSLMEGFGLPVLEAMANKSLVLASDIPSLREVGKDACIYVDPLNITSLSAKMQQIVDGDPKDFQDLKIKGSTLIKDYSWKRMAEQTLEVYDECISSMVN